jgi:hypothetical protein
MIYECVRCNGKNIKASYVLDKLLFGLGLIDKLTQSCPELLTGCLATQTSFNTSRWYDFPQLGM